MADQKRYCWIKLHDDFFDSKRIKKLRSLAGGDTFTIIYLKMQLKAMKTEGILEYTGVEPTIAEEIALDIDENPDNVQVTLNFLMSCGLAELDDSGDCFFPYAVENTGGETAAAQRVREHRERKKALQCNTDVTQPALQAPESETEVKRECNVDKEKEKDEDIELEKEKDIEKEKPSGGGGKGNAFAELAGDDNQLLEALKAFEDMRKMKKKPLTDLARKRLVSELEKYPREEWTAIVEQSVVHSWEGFYPLKPASRYAQTHDTGQEEAHPLPKSIQRKKT